MASNTWSAGITAFQHSIAALPQLGADVADDIAKDIAVDLQKKYSAGKNPYGAAWKPRKHRYPWKILHKTGKLYRSLEVKADNGAITITRGRGLKYGGFHQHGTAYLPVRLIVPISSKGLPKETIDAFLKRVKQRFAKLFPK